MLSFKRDRNALCLTHGCTGRLRTELDDRSSVKIVLLILYASHK